MRQDQTMRINAPRGQKIRFSPRSNEETEECHEFYLDREYTVDRTIIYSSISYVVTQEIPDREINTVYFQEVSPHIDETQTCEEIYNYGLRQRMGQRST